MIFKRENIIFFLGKANIWMRSLYLEFHGLIRKFLRTKINDDGIFIQRLYFEVTNICNLRCRFCIYSKKAPQKQGIMKFDIFKKAIDEFGELGGRAVSFTPIIGEPLLDPGLIEKIKYALSIHSIKKVYFYTNGTLLSKNDNYKKLIDSGITDIEISISAFDKDIYKKIHQIDAYEQTLDGIYKLLQYNDSRGRKTKIGINFRSPVLPSVVLGSNDFRKYIKPFLGDSVSYSFLSTYDNWCGNITQKDLCGVMKLRRINHFKYLPCMRTYDAIILFDGGVRLCATRMKDSKFDELVVGNVTTHSLRDIFYSSKTKEMRESFFGGRTPSACKGCSLYIPMTKRMASRYKQNKNLYLFE